MKSHLFENFVLTAIAIFLGIIALRPLVMPPVVRAQGADKCGIYIEPGTHMLRAPDGKSQMYGRVMVDLCTGNVYGYPTMTNDTYPVDITSKEPPTSNPIHLGRFNLEAMKR